MGAIPYFNKKDLSDSIRGTANWASSKKSSISYQSPLKVIIWASIIIIAILGLLAQ
jgi:rhomboid protease GluP